MEAAGTSSRRATLYDVCRRTGLSTATVSRVINASPRVTAETRQRVMEAMAELGYVPSQTARALAGQQQKMLGVIFPDINVGFYAQVLRGIDSIAAERGYHVMTAFSHGVSDEQDLVMRFLREGRIDALILMNVILGDEFVREAAKATTPLVLVDRPVARCGASSIAIDNIGGARSAMAHLYGHGYRTIALLCGEPENFDAQQRLQGCREAAAEAGAMLDERLIWSGNFREESGRTAMTDWLDRGRPLPEAVFCFNDAMAIGVMDVLREKEYRVPEDVAVVGFDDVESARHLRLTTVSVPMTEMGRRAAGAAIDVLNEEQSHPEIHSVLQTELVIRASCGCEVR